MHGECTKSEERAWRDGRGEGSDSSGSSPSGRYQALYTGPDLVRRPAPSTFQARIDAEAWLAREQALIAADAWTPPAERAKPAAAPTSLAAYAESWLARRDLKPTTRQHYRQLLDRAILPSLGYMPLGSITPRLVADWHHGLDPKRRTWRSHAYGLLRTILGTAVLEQEIQTNPCHIRGAGTTKRSVKIEPATLAQLEAIAAHMPAKYRPMVMLSSWCGLRFGEVAELRRRDLDLRQGVVHVRRGVTRADGHTVVGSPKSDAGTRDVAIPPHLVPSRDDAPGEPRRCGPDALLFPAAADGTSHLAPSTLYKVYYPARKAAGGPTCVGTTCATPAPSWPPRPAPRWPSSWDDSATPRRRAAMRYQHAAKGRDAQIAAALSRLVE